MRRRGKSAIIETAPVLGIFLPACGSHCAGGLRLCALLFYRKRETYSVYVLNIPAGRTRS